MANTYTLIASNTLSSSAASVTFSSIPSTYTDLVLRISARTDESGSTFSDLWVRYNNDTTTLYSNTFLQGSGAAASSNRTSSTTLSRGNNQLTAVNATSNTFGNIEVYIPNYTSTINKPVSLFGVGETNATTAYISTVASLYRNTTAIDRLDILTNNGNFVSGSSFFLYGIKNS